MGSIKYPWKYTKERDHSTNHLIPPTKQSMGQSAAPLEHSEIPVKIIRTQFQKLRRAKPKEIKSQLKKKPKFFQQKIKTRKHINKRKIKQ
jgi:hypothetical protein